MHVESDMRKNLLLDTINGFLKATQNELHIIILFDASRNFMNSLSRFMIFTSSLLTNAEVEDKKYKNQPEIPLREKDNKMC